MANRGAWVPEAQKLELEREPDPDPAMREFDPALACWVRVLPDVDMGGVRPAGGGAWPMLDGSGVWWTIIDQQTG